VPRGPRQGALTVELATGAPAARPPAVAPAAVVVDSVSKDFVVPDEAHGTVRDRVVHPLRRRPPAQVLEALRDVTLEIERGSCFGILGKNGSGKSTLLRCIAGIYPVDAGAIRVRGRVAPFIELGAGFDVEMPVRDNVITQAVLHGVRRRDAVGRVDEILAFAGLESYAGAKLKNLSTGMVMRLAFSATVQVDADVLLFDEVLAVGDASFRRRCDERFARLREEGRTIVLVSHDSALVKEQCDRAMLLDRGRVVEIGAPEAVAGGYERVNARDDGAGATRGPALPARPAPPRPPAAPFAARLRRLGAVTAALAVSAFRRRYLDSALSYLWAVMRPLAFFAVLLLVFTQIGNFDDGVTHYPLYLLTAIALWTFFSESTQTAVWSLVERGALIRTLPIPRLAVPLSVTLTSLLDLCMTLLAVLAALLVTGIEPRVEWLELLVIVALLTMFVAGTGLLLSVLYVRYRDVDHLWQVVRQTLFYVSPIIYVAALYPDAVEEAALASPLAAAVTQARHALIDPNAPSAAAAAGGGAWILVPIAIAAGTLALGLWAFDRGARRAAERL
jgi:ABC-type polysaccharide/polyol phosphate transport system ATPase subunit/ABC-type polysaccharide/polyol phosphate export permease